MRDSRYCYLSNMYKQLVFVLLFVCALAQKRKCGCKGKETITTVSGSQAPRKFCSGDLIFQDSFEKLNFKNWKHDLTLGGGGNWEFQWYVNNRSNSFAKDGKLFIKPTLSVEVLGEEKLTNYTLDVDYCTDSRFYGCSRRGTEDHVLNPIRSAKLTTKDSFAFKYGRVQIRAKMPTGDWLWPGIWMLPLHDAYGKWPGSGTIVLAQYRGNPEYWDDNGVNIGAEQFESNLHWGPDVTHDAYEKHAMFIKRHPRGRGWDDGFHNYGMEWTQDYIKFSIDGEVYASVQPNATMWDLGNFDSRLKHNPYKYATKMAPFDEEFYFIVNLAVGGIFYWRENNRNDKPWSNKGDRAATDFWTARDTWLKSWKLHEGDTAALQIEYVKVWAL